MTLVEGMRIFSCRTNAGNPEQARPTWVANQNRGITSTYLLTDLAI